MDQIHLLRGDHATREAGLCVMEAVAFFAGEPHSDAPQCACPVITRFAQRLNDRLDDAHRQELKPLIPALALSRISPKVERKRMYVAADLAVRRWAADALEARAKKRPDLAKHARALRALAPVVNKGTALNARAAAAAAAVDAADAAAAAAADAAADAAAAAAVDAAADAADAAAAAAAVDARQDYLLKTGVECLHAMLAVTA